MDSLLEFLFAVFSKVARIMLISSELSFGLLLIAAFLFGVWVFTFVIHVVIRAPVRTEPTQAVIPQDESRANWLTRAAASIIDVFLSWTGPFIVLIATISALRWHSANGFQGSYSGPYFSVDSLLWWTFGVALSAGSIVWWAITLQRAQTPGKRIFGIRAVRSDTGQPISWGMMFVREFLVKWFPFWFAPSWYFLIWHLYGFEFINDLPLLNTDFIAYSLLLFFVIPLLTLFPLDSQWPLWDKDDQALHDKVVRTYVVRVPGR